MNFDKNFKGIENFDSSKCKIEKKKKPTFQKDERPMGCSTNCWSTCIGFPTR